MPTQADVRQIALSLPGVEQEPGWFAFWIANRKGKPIRIAWVWRERIHPRKARVPNPEVLAIRVADEVEKATLLGADPDKFFTEPHYNGYPAVLVRLKTITKPELRSLITEAWRIVTRGSLADAKPSKKAKAPKTNAKTAARATATRGSSRAPRAARTARTAARGASARRPGRARSAGR